MLDSCSMGRRLSATIFKCKYSKRRSCPQEYLEGMQKLIHVYDVKLESKNGDNLHKHGDLLIFIRQGWSNFGSKSSLVVLDNLDGTDPQELQHRRQLGAINCPGSIPPASLGVDSPVCRGPYLDWFRHLPIEVVLGSSQVQLTDFVSGI